MEFGLGATEEKLFKGVDKQSMTERQTDGCWQTMEGKWSQ